MPRIEVVRRVTGLGAAMLALALASPALAADGAALYGEHCAKCHGADGKADTPVGRAMKAPALAATSHTADEVRAVVRENGKHKPIASKVSDDDLAAIAAHLQTLASGS